MKIYTLLYQKNDYYESKEFLVSSTDLEKILGDIKNTFIIDSWYKLEWTRKGDDDFYIGNEFREKNLLAYSKSRHYLKEDDSTFKETHTLYLYCNND